jgi:hypothetical protein
MSVTLWTALLVQVSAITLLRMFLGRLWLRSPAVLLVLTSAVYLGVSPVLLSFPSLLALDTYRTGLQQSYADEATLVMAAGMLAFTIAYLIFRPRSLAGATEPDAAVMTGLDWRWLALACIPLAVLTYQGKGFNTTQTTGGSAAMSVAATFYVITLVLAAAGLVLRHGHFPLVLAVQSALLAAAGERTPVLMDAVTLIVLLAHAGRRPTARQLQVTAGVTVAAMLAITGARSEQGRALFTADSSFSARVLALGAGLMPGSGQAATPGLVAQAADRTDGVAFPGAILQAERLGQGTLPAAGVPESLLIAVPSAVWPSKLAHALNPVQAQINDFGLRQVNYLAALPGFYMGFLSPLWMVAVMAVTGLAWGPAERWLFRRLTPVRAVMLAGAVTAAFRFEAGLPAMAVALRAAATIAVLVWAAARIMRLRAGAA